MPPSTAQKLSLEQRQSRYDQQRPQLLPSLTARGLDAEAVADRFRLGYVAPNEEDPRRYWHRMAIPYLTPTGIVQIRYRCLIDHHGKGQDAGGCPKFLGDPGAEITLYNAHATLDAGPILFLAEGEPDVWAIETLTGYPAVGIPGAQSWDKYPHWARCFVNFERLILPADGDAAGSDLATRVAKTLPEVTVVQLPDGEDATSVLARDPGEFAARCGL